jgi:hypothetical protein
MPIQQEGRATPLVLRIAVALTTTAFYHQEPAGTGGGVEDCPGRCLR